MDVKISVKAVGVIIIPENQGNVASTRELRRRLGSFAVDRELGITDCDCSGLAGSSRSGERRSIPSASSILAGEDGQLSSISLVLDVFA